MKRITQVIILLTLVACQNSGDMLSDGSWIVSKGIYNNQEISFTSFDKLKIADRHGNIHVTMKFFQDGRIIIPGIESHDIYCNWKIINDQLYISIDSSKYDFIYDKDEDKLKLIKTLTIDSLEINRIDSVLESEQNSKFTNPLKTGEFKKVIDIYGNPFDIRFSEDNLILTSSTTTIVAKKDKSLDDLFRGL